VRRNPVFYPGKFSAVEQVFNSLFHSESHVIFSIRTDGQIGIRLLAKNHLPAFFPKIIRDVVADEDADLGTDKIGEPIHESSLLRISFPLIRFFNLF
jgi:hypothetical protein